MLCPQCQQGVQTEELEAGRCPYCGFPCAELHRQVNYVQLILAVLFGTTLLYGILVVVLELVYDYRAPGLGDHEFTLGMALLGATAGVFIASVMFERRATEPGKLGRYTRIFLVLGAVAELPAFFGLVMYLLTGSLQWMVLFLLICWALLIRLGLRLPQLLQGITDCLRTE